jgi:hypothetical protein
MKFIFPQTRALCHHNFCQLAALMEVGYPGTGIVSDNIWSRLFLSASLTAKKTAVTASGAAPGGSCTAGTSSGLTQGGGVMQRNRTPGEMTG